MSTNDKKADEANVQDEDEVTEDDLKNLKYGGVESDDESEDENTEDENTEEDDEDTGDDEDENTEDDAEENSEEEDDSDDDSDDANEFVKEFPNIKGDSLEDYSRGLEKAYQNSTSEALRLKRELDELKSSEDYTPPDNSNTSPAELYMKQKMDEEINTAYQEVVKKYPQVQEQQYYDAFTREVAVLSKTILESQGRLAPPSELYKKATAILGWESADEITDGEKTTLSIKNRISTGKTSNGAKSTKRTKSKVNQAMIEANRKMYPDKTDAEIRAELEPYVN